MQLAGASDTDEVRQASVDIDFSLQELIFCLNELLKLQVSIASSLEVACLAFRHADRDLSDNIRRAFNEA